MLFDCPMTPWLCNLSRMCHWKYLQQVNPSLHHDELACYNALLSTYEGVDRTVGLDRDRLQFCLHCSHSSVDKVKLLR